MDLVEVYADVACPFAHAGLARFVAYRGERGRTEPRLRVRAWPLELVNGSPFDGSALAPKVEALRAGVAPDRFGGFDPAGFPRSSLPAMASEAAAHRASPEVGERFSLAVRSSCRAISLVAVSPVAGSMKCASTREPARESAAETVSAWS